jgi:hypothetical protein
MLQDYKQEMMNLHLTLLFEVNIHTPQPNEDQQPDEAFEVHGLLVHYLIPLGMIRYQQQMS